MNRRILTSVVTAMLLLTQPAEGWWETGHRTVARIAAAQLSATARTRIARILGVADTTVAIADALATGSTWPDEIKNQTQTGSWHFIDIALQDSKSDLLSRCKDNDCVSGRIRLFSMQLSSQKSNGQWSELDAIRFLVHFVADAHQPLHAVDDEDLGGNCEPLDPPIGKAKNLHALWDGELVNALDADDRQLSTDLEGYIAKLSAATRDSWTGGSVDDWVWESHLLAKTQIYEKLHIPVKPVAFPASCKEAPHDIVSFRPAIDTLYLDSMKPVVRDQLVKAGLRLARVLNESL